MYRLAPLLVPLGLFSSVPACANEQVPLPQFSFVELRGQGEVVFVHGPSSRVTIAEGSRATSRLYVDADRRLIIESCAASCPPSYRLRVQIESPTFVPTAVKGGGRVKAVTGFPDQEKLFIAVDGNGTVDARMVPAADVFAAAQRGGNLFVRPTSNLFAVAEGAQVHYWGSPRLMTKGGGSSGPGIVREGP